jgi:hypothetical protein
MSDLKKIAGADLDTLLFERPEEIPQRVEFWINGEKHVDPIRSLVMRLVVPGRANIQIVYGFNPTIGATGVDDITRREVGGVISAYFTAIDGQLYVGMLRQKRPCQDLTEPILNVIRAYYDPTKSRLSQATERAEERAGITVTLPMVQLPCDLGNSNNASVETHGGNGNAHFAFYVPKGLLVAGSNDSYVFDSSTVKAFDTDAGKILGLEFHPWKKAARVGDDFTRGIVSPLLAWLDDIGQIAVVVDGDFDIDFMAKQ